jgi:hypothetical protein
MTSRLDRIAVDSEVLGSGPTVSGGEIVTRDMAAAITKHNRNAARLVALHLQPPPVHPPVVALLPGLLLQEHEVRGRDLNGLAEALDYRDRTSGRADRRLKLLVHDLEVVEREAAPT